MAIEVKETQSPPRDKKRLAIEGIGQAFFGSRWQTYLAKALGYSGQHLGGVMSGKYPVSDDLIDELVKWTRETGLPEMKGRYKRIYQLQVELALLAAEERGEFDIHLDEDDETPSPIQGLM